MIKDIDDAIRFVEESASMSRHQADVQEKILDENRAAGMELDHVSVFRKDYEEFAESQMEVAEYLRELKSLRERLREIKIFVNSCVDLCVDSEGETTHVRTADIPDIDSRKMVSRQAVLNLTKTLRFPNIKGLEHYGYRCIDPNEVMELPTVQPEIIRCGKCKYSYREYSGEIWKCDGLGIEDDSFCSSTERRTDGCNQQTGGD